LPGRGLELVESVLHLEVHRDRGESGNDADPGRDLDSGEREPEGEVGGLGCHGDSAPCGESSTGGEDATGEHSDDGPEGAEEGGVLSGEVRQVHEIRDDRLERREERRTDGLLRLVDRKDFIIIFNTKLSTCCYLTPSVNESF